MTANRKQKRTKTMILEEKKRIPGRWKDQKRRRKNVRGREGLTAEEVYAGGDEIEREK